MSLIQTLNLGKDYQLGKITIHALSQINLQVEEGEFVAITGESGSGKSTLLHLLGCLDTPSTGKYFFDGVEINQRVNLPLIRREKIGFVFQNFNLLSKLSALQNVELPMIYKGLKSSVRKARAQQLLSQVGLADRVHHRPTELSGGQTQRVAIARALSNEPKLILADEPTGNLDSQSGEEILEALSQLNENGTTLIIVTHEDYIARKARRMLRLKDGEIIEDRRLKSRDRD